jgi:hypothetical protein
MATMIFSVCPGAGTTDYKSGSPVVWIDGSAGARVAHFSVAQSDNLVGVGLKVTYDTSLIMYLQGKVAGSNSNWYVKTATGGDPATISEGSPVNVNSIQHVWTAATTAEGAAGGASYLNTLDLVTATLILRFACYCAGSTADTTGCVISGWTTSASYYIEFFTPFDTATECNLSQRHLGIWNTSKYNSSVNAQYGVNFTLAECARITGIQCEQLASNWARYNIDHITENTTTRIDKCILRNNYAATLGQGINIVSGIQVTLLVYNSIIHGLAGKLVRGYYDAGSASGSTVGFYNCTIYNCSSGVWPRYADAANTITMVNCVAMGSTADFAGGTGTESYTYCCSQDATADDFGATGCLVSKVVANQFLDAANGDFRIKDTSADIYNSGSNHGLFTDDIAGVTRAQWDMGAFGYVAAGGGTILPMMMHHHGG